LDIYIYIYIYEKLKTIYTVEDIITYRKRWEDRVHRMGNDM